jgi:hypothetical protein
MTNRIIRQQILEEFLKNIVRLSDEKYQERVWVRAEGPECNDIDDAVCDFFDDGNPILEKYKEYGITECQYKLLMELYSKLRFFTDTFGVYSSVKSTEQLIKLPKWQEIRDISKKVIKSFYKN